MPTPSGYSLFPSKCTKKDYNDKSPAEEAEDHAYEPPHKEFILPIDLALFVACLFTKSQDNCASKNASQIDNHSFKNLS